MAYSNNKRKRSLSLFSYQKILKPKCILEFRAIFASKLLEILGHIFLCGVLRLGWSCHQIFSAVLLSQFTVSS